MSTKKKILIFDIEDVLINSLKNMQIAFRGVLKKFNLKIRFESCK